MLTLSLLALQTPASASTCAGDPHEPDDSLLPASVVDRAQGTQDLLGQPDPGSPGLDVHRVHVRRGAGASTAPMASRA